MDNFFPDDWNPEFANWIIGDMIGEGEHRQVFVFKPDPTLVIKIDHSGTFFANIEEWKIWSEAQEAGHQDWFAPISGISANGHFLVMARTDPLPRLPDQVPNFVADVKLSNWGLFKGRPVLHDYANHSIYTRGFGNMRMRRLTKAERRRP